MNLEQPPFRAKGAEVLCARVVVQVVWVGVERVDGAGTEKRSVSISPGGLLVDCARRFQCLLTGFKIQKHLKCRIKSRYLSSMIFCEIKWFHMIFKKNCN